MCLDGMFHLFVEDTCQVLDQKLEGPGPKQWGVLSTC